MAFREEYAEARPVPADMPVKPRHEPEAAVPPAVAKAPPRRSRKRLVLGAVALAVLTGGGYEGWRWWTDGRFLVSTDDAYVQADITTLAAKVSGYLASVEVVNNQSVRKGDVIARVDDGDYRLALRAASDKLATQRSAIERLGRQVEAARASVDQAAAQIDAARADQVRAAADYRRQIQLSQSDFASKARLEQARADRDRADANLKGMEASREAASANVAVLVAQRTEAERLADELQTAVDRAARDLEFTVLRAPFDGVVGNKAVEVGAYVQPGSRIAALVPLASVRVDANFKETQLARMRVGQEVRIHVDAYPDRRIVGTVESLAPASGSVFSLLPPENATGNFTKIVQRVPVRVKVPTDLAREGILRPGLSVVASVDIRTDGGEPVADAPQPAPEAAR